jgi:peptidoglycan/xylan/chitin deacetylase (PgdA/CDA1 family)
MGYDASLKTPFPSSTATGCQPRFFLTANRESTHESWYGHTDDWWKIDWREDDIASLRSLINHGHEVGSHSLTHHIQKMQVNPQAEACQSKELIEGWLGTKITSFCYPYCSSHSYLADAVKNAGYQQARAGDRGSYYPVHAAQSCDRFNVDSRLVQPNENVSEWLRPGHWHVLMFHAIGDQRDGWAPISVGQFSALMAELAKYRDGGTVEILPFGCAVERLDAQNCDA